MILPKYNLNTLEALEQDHLGEFSRIKVNDYLGPVFANIKIQIKRCFKLIRPDSSVFFTLRLYLISNVGQMNKVRYRVGPYPNAGDECRKARLFGRLIRALSGNYQSHTSTRRLFGRVSSQVDSLYIALSGGKGHQGLHTVKAALPYWVFF